MPWPAVSTRTRQGRQWTYSVVMSKQDRGAPRARSARRPLSTPVEELSTADQSLFRDAVGELRRFAPVAELPRGAPPLPSARMSEADERAVIDELLTHPLDNSLHELGDPLRYLKPGLPARLLKQLGRGAYSVRDEFDLHAMSSGVALAALARFLEECLREDRLCVRIIHGKGLRSGDRGPVIKGLVDRALRRRGDVLAYRSAASSDGGSGAVIVLLRGRQR